MLACSLSLSHTHTHTHTYTHTRTHTHTSIGYANDRSYLSKQPPGLCLLTLNWERASLIMSEREGGRKDEGVKGERETDGT